MTGKILSRRISEKTKPVFWQNAIPQSLGMETEYSPHFIETLPELMALIAAELVETDGFRNRYAAEMVILLGCVDNNRTRQLCHEAFRQSEDLVYIDSGNGSYTGQVVCGVRRNRHTMRKPIGSVHPEMLRITDKFPSELSCAEARRRTRRASSPTSRRPLLF